MSAVALGLLAAGGLLLLVLAAIAARVLPVDWLGFAGAHVAAQAQIALTWTLSSVLVSTCGWLLLTVTPMSSAELEAPTPLLGIALGILGLLLGMGAHAWLLTRLVWLGRRRFSAAASHFEQIARCDVNPG